MIIEILEKIDAEEVFDPFFGLYEKLPEDQKNGYLKETHEAAQELFWICKMAGEGLFDEIVVFDEGDKENAIESRVKIAKKELDIDEVFACDALERYMVVT